MCTQVQDQPQWLQATSCYPPRKLLEKSSEVSIKVGYLRLKTKKGGYEFNVRLCGEVFFLEALQDEAKPPRNSQSELSSNDSLKANELH